MPQMRKSTVQKHTFTNVHHKHDKEHNHKSRAYNTDTQQQQQQQEQQHIKQLQRHKTIKTQSHQKSTVTKLPKHAKYRNIWLSYTFGILPKQQNTLKTNILTVHMHKYTVKCNELLYPRPPCNGEIMISLSPPLKPITA